MTGCELGIGKTFDLGLCLKSSLFAWVPDWIWPLLPYWPWLVVIGGLGMAYRVAGWPGVVAFAGGLGFLAGRRSVKTDDAHEQVVGEDATPPVPVKKKLVLFPKK